MNNVCEISFVLLQISTEVASTLNLTGSFDEGGVTYRTMTCDFSAPFPLQAGSHSYTAVISPGGVEPEVNFRGSSDIGMCWGSIDMKYTFLLQDGFWCVILTSRIDKDKNHLSSNNRYSVVLCRLLL